MNTSDQVERQHIHPDPPLLLHNQFLTSSRSHDRERVSVQTTLEIRTNVCEAQGPSSSWRSKVKKKEVSKPRPANKGVTVAPRATMANFVYA
jgi:hypothetical protein